MATDYDAGRGAARSTERARRFFAVSRSSFLPSQWIGLGWSVLITATSTAIAEWASPHLELAGVLVIYLLGVVVIALSFGTAVAVFSAISNVLVFDFIFIPPPLCFSMPDLTSAVTCGGMLIVAAVVSGLTTRIKRDEASALNRETRTSILYALSRALAEATNTDELAKVASAQFEQLTALPVAILIRDDDEGLDPPVGSLEIGQVVLDAIRATWKSNGRATSVTDGNRRFDFFPLPGARKPVGLVVFESGGRQFARTEQERELVEVCSRQTAMAVERFELATRANNAQLFAEAERARSAFLSSLSHDFRTPLAAIVGAGNSLAEFGDRLDPHERRDLVQSIVDEAERLHRLLTNVLALTRLEGSGVGIKTMPHALEEIVDSALRGLGARIGSRRVAVDAPVDLPMALLEPMLTEQLLMNVFENALRYSPDGSPIDVKLGWTESDVTVRVADRGRGVPPGDESRIFEKFFRSANADQRDGGTGLGLAICRAIARAQDGRIDARNRDGGGLEVTFCVPRTGEPATSGLVAPVSERAAGRSARW